MEEARVREFTGTQGVSFDLSSFYHRRLTLYGLDTMALDTVASGVMPDAMLCMAGWWIGHRPWRDAALFASLEKPERS